jgi:phenylalanyl-tRNA synthetase beta chain
VAELKLSTLMAIAQLVPQYRQPPVFPAVSRDLNLVVDEGVPWEAVATTVRQAAAPHAERVELQDVYRDAERLGPGKKSLLLAISLRSASGTLTGEQADEVQARVVAACSKNHAAQLRA